MRIKFIFSILIITLLLNSSIAQAATGYYFNGGAKSGDFYGVKGNIECDPVTVSNDASVWIMITGTGNYDYLQVGWGKNSGETKNWHFYQYSNSGGYYHDQTSVASTGTHSYKLDLVSGVWKIYVNGSQVSSVSDSTLGWSGRDEAQFYGEIHDSSGDQNPGTVTDPITMGYLKVKNSSGTWSGASLTRTKTSLTHQKNNADVGDTTFEQWDNRY
jgi:hypothetical protein